MTTYYAVAKQGDKYYPGVFEITGGTQQEADVAIIYVTGDVYNTWYTDRRDIAPRDRVLRGTIDMHKDGTAMLNIFKDPL